MEIDGPAHVVRPFLQGADRVVRVLPALARHERHDHEALLGQAAAAIEHARSDLEQPDGGGALPQVVRARAQQAGQQVRPQHFAFAAHRVHEAHELRFVAERFGRGERFALGDERAAPRLVQSAREHRFARTAHDALTRRAHRLAPPVCSGASGILS